MYYIPLTKSERNLYDDDKNMNEFYNRAQHDNTQMKV